MTQPTRQEIITAYEALETLTDTCIHSSEQAEELQELVLRALPPKPQPTMAEEEWDDDKHYLAEAEHVSWGKMVMIYHDRFGSIRCAVKGEVYIAAREDLTPTGKRYTLTEVQDD